MGKALIRREKPKGEAIEVLFNPPQYGLDASNQLSETAVVGLDVPLLQWRSNARSLTMELFFDTYERRTDVREHTNRLYGLLDVDPSTHQPPVCTFSWGKFNFRCVVEQVSGRFTLFLDDGTPVRASLSVTLKEFVDPKTAAQASPTQSAGHTKTYPVKRGDMLSSIAAAEYGDSAKWRPIAEANRIVNPRTLTPGRLLVIPPLPQA